MSYKQIVALARDNSSFDEFELIELRKQFPTYFYRSDVPNNSLVIGRYSVLPYYSELETDLSRKNSVLINSRQQHEFISKFQYYEYLKQFTFKTYFDYNFYLAPEGQYVVKGETNSKKFSWNKEMFAANKRRATEIAALLKNDGQICDQSILYRQYVPLETFEIGLNGIRFTNEYRLFFYKDKMLCSGYYWSPAKDALKYHFRTLEPQMLSFAQQIANIISNYVNFYVMDLAKTESGEWILVELNDGQMSGLSMCDPALLYQNLGNELCKNI